MTTPGGVPNLPKGALTIDTLASNLQNMTGSAMRNRASDRFPSIFNNSTGGNPAIDLTPLGILTRIWAEVNSLIANADPADIQGPEDLPELVLEFIEGLPVIGQFIDLLEAILGNYDGDDETLLTIQEIFAPIRAIVSAIQAAVGAGNLANFFNLGGSTSILGAITSPFQQLFNKMVDGTTGSTGASGKSLDDVLSALRTQSGLIGGIGTNADSALGALGVVQSALTALTPHAFTAFEQSVLNTLTLGQRANKSAAMGANPTSQTSFTSGHFSAAGSLSTTLAAGTAIAQRYTVPETATNGFMEILAAGSGVTNIFVNVFKINPLTNVKTALFNSANIASLIPTTMTDHTRTLLPGMPAVNPGDELLLEVVNGGSNALTLATKTSSAPNNSHEVIQNVGFSRSIASTGGTSPTSLTAGQGAYSGTVPYAVIGIANVPADYHPPEQLAYTPRGTYSYTLPSFLDTGDFVDLIGVGAGGAGQGEQGYNLGQGGRAGAWNVQRLVVGTDIAIGGTITVTVGRGGPKQLTYFANGVAGTATIFTWTKPGTGLQILTCAGGAGGSGAGVSYGGGSPGDEEWQGQTYRGGAAVGSGSAGSAPGGGGGGAPPYLFGGAGADGEAWIVGTQA